jgi:flagellar hook-associated protein 2
MGDVLGGSIRTDSNGRTTVTGVGSDIDFGETVDAIIEAKRQPAVRLENRIAENQAKVDAMTELQSRLATLETAVSGLRGRPTFDNSGNVFENKEGFFSASRTDGQTASQATSILVANVENSAQPSSHDLEVLRTAQGEQIASDAVTDSGTDLGFSGEFSVNGRQVNVTTADSLADVRDKINAVNRGDNATGVNAQIVSVSDTQKVLTLTAENEGESIVLDDDSAGDGDTPLQSLGLLNGSEAFKNPLRDAETSILRADGLSDGSVQESTAQSSSTAALDTLGVSSGTFDLDFQLETSGRSGPVTRTLTGVDTTNASLDSLASRINDEIEDVSARVVDNGSGPQLELNAEFMGDLQTTDDLGIAGGDTLDQISGVDSGDSVTFRIANDGAGGAPSSTEFTFDTSTNTLNDVQAAIDGTAGLSATISGGALEIESDNGGTLKISDVSGEFVQDIGLEQSNDVPTLTTSDVGGDIVSGLGIADADAISRKGNTIDDLFSGTTLDLFKAERGTNIQFDIERDQDAVNTAINDFVTAFNDVKRFINAQRENVAIDEQDPNSETSIVGALENESILREVEQDLSRLISGGATNVSTDFEVLGQVGIDFVDNDSLSDSTLEDTLEIDQDELNDKLLNDFESLRNLFAFNFSTNSSNAQMTGFTGNTAAADKFVKVETDGDNNIVNVAIGDSSGLAFGADDVSFTASGNRLTIDEGELQGLSILYSGGASTSEEFQVSTSTGIGSEAFFTADKLGNTQPRDGVVQSEIDRITGRSDANITGQNERFQDEIDRIEDRLDAERERLIRQFTAMEQALIELESAQSRLEQFAQAGSGDN